MKKVGTVLFLIVFLGIGFFNFLGGNWSPWNLLWGPQYDARQHGAEPSLNDFINSTLPELYPKLLVHVRNEGSQAIEWRSEAGDRIIAALSPYRNGLVLDTSTIVQDSEGNESRVDIRFFDETGDARLELVEYTEENGTVHPFSNPTDETTIFMWNSSLAMAFRLTECCQ